MSGKQYCRYYNDPSYKIPRRTEYRLKKKERIERLAREYVILTNKNTERILVHSNSQEVEHSSINRGQNF